MENYAALQQALIELMRKNGSLKTPVIAQAFQRIPRHLFLPEEPLERAYSDIAIAVRKGAENQWTSSSSQPTMMAIMLEQLDLQPGMRVLEIGAGSGYNAALMGVLVGPSGRVVTIDIQPDLIEEASQIIAGLGLDWVEAIAGDGGYGYPAAAPYDRILLTVSSDVITPAWREQLAEGGRLVLPLAIGKTQKSIAFERRAETLFSLSISDCGFMVLQGAFAAEPQITTLVGADPLVKVISNQLLPASSETLDGWLSGSFTDQPSGVSAKSFGVWGGLFTWLTLLEPGWAQLLAEGEATEQQRIPEFFYMGNGKEFRSRSTALLVAEDGMAALVRPPGNAAPYQDWNSPDDDSKPAEPVFELYIRQYGSGSGAAQRLLEAVRAWGQAGQPGSEQMYIRAIPAEIDAARVPGEYVVEKPYTRLFVHFATT